MAKSRLWALLVLLSVILTIRRTACAAEAPAEDALRPGLISLMFESTDLTRPVGMSVLDQVNVDTGEKIKDYSRLWLGRIKPPVDGKIEVFAEADDGLRLSIGGRSVIDGWGADRPRSGSFMAKANEPFPLRLDYYQDGGVGFVRLYWSWRGQPRQVIPADALFHTAADEREAEKIMSSSGPPAAPPVPPAPASTPDKSFIYEPARKYPTTSPSGATPVHPGPHLLVDDALIASSQNLSRIVRQPPRDPAIPNPVITAKEDGSFQPYLSVSRSPETGRFRAWYGISSPEQSTHTSDLAYLEGDDGIHWDRPHRVADIPRPMQFGSEVLDRGPYWPDSSQRYLYSYWFGGLCLAVSADGLHFSKLVERPVVPHNHDIDSIAWDPLRQRYVATMSTMTSHPRFKGSPRRTTMQSFSTNLLDWTPPVFVLIADSSVDPGETQFYAMEGYLTRGPLRIGMVKVLRDDLFSDTPEVLEKRQGGFGIGYTTLAWSRDGEHWIRDREVFLDRGPIGSWDRSHTWVDEQLIVGDEVYLYYAGYRSGHKANRFTDRQIGLVKMPLDRYVARRAGQQPGTLLTTPLKLDARSRRLLINTDASRAGGELRVQVRDAAKNSVIDGLSFDDCRPITGDGLRTPVIWGDEAQTRRKLTGLGDSIVQLEFKLSNASLFSFDFVDVFEQEPPPPRQ